MKSGYLTRLIAVNLYLIEPCRHVFNLDFKLCGKCSLMKNSGILEEVVSIEIGL